MSAAARSLEYLARSNPGAASEDHRSRRPLPPDSGTANMHRRAGHPYLCRLWSDTLGHGGLDLRTTMFAPCLLGCPHSWRKRRSANQSSIRAVQVAAGTMRYQVSVVCNVSPQCRQDG